MAFSSIFSKMATGVKHYQTLIPFLNDFELILQKNRPFVMLLSIGTVTPLNLILKALLVTKM